MMKLFLVGGFLGSGKTTAIQKASMLLLDKGMKVGVITNDQGDQLVDHRFIQSFGIPSMEVVNGCFCCRFDQLQENVESLVKVNSTEVIFAESVGSCTDLVATIVKPFSKFHSDVEIVLSVFVDARALPTMIRGSRLFTDNVNYIYRKQVEEADVLVVNKVDLLNEDQLNELMDLVKSHYPEKIVTYQDSLDEQSIEHWLKLLGQFNYNKNRKNLDVDYDIYGAGEAELAWLDQEVIIGTSEKSGVQCSFKLIKEIYAKIVELKLPIGHLKFHLDTVENWQKISFTSINDDIAKLQPEIEEVDQVRLLINARVQTDSQRLKELVAASVRELESQSGCRIEEKFVSAFQPGYPRPTYRILN